MTFFIFLNIITIGTAKYAAIFYEQKGNFMLNINKNKRSAGVLLHIASLPNKYGVGTFGKSAYDFVDTLKGASVKYWQILPLVQTGFGDSPYQSVCSYSGNPYFIDPEILYGDGLLNKEELESAQMPSGRINYGELYVKRYALLRSAFSRFDVFNKDFRKFSESKRFDAYAKFLTLKKAFNNAPFVSWDHDFKYCNEELVSDFIRNNLEEYNFWLFVQFQFERQWKKLKAYANSKGIKFIGDIPLYVAYDSADVWSDPKAFKLDRELNMTEVAGVPPDYFSKEGQLWGNPLYDWEKHGEDGYKWWINRIKNALQIYDVVRIDHFRGLDRYYSVAADAENAIDGEWQEGPKMKLFDAAKKSMGNLPIIAEDLGLLDDGVKKLLKDSKFPGMKVLLFAFDGDKDNDYRPENINKNSVTYTGTHDNDTVMGYVASLSEEEKEGFIKEIDISAKKRKLKLDIKTDGDILNALLTLAMECDSNLCVVPMQDVLGLDNSSRMNIPGTSEANWSFRLSEMPNKENFKFLKELIVKYKRN